MSEMIERVARAIFTVSAPYVDHCCNEPDFNKCPCSSDAREQARKAIEAMGEPTPDMLIAAYREVGIPQRPMWANCYRAMMRAALKEPT